MRFIVVLLAFTHLLAGIGINLSKHYCMGELRGVSIFSSDPRTCACPSNAEYAKAFEDMGCCHSEHEFLHLEDDLQCKIFQTNLDTQVFPNFSQHFEYIF